VFVVVAAAAAAAYFIIDSVQKLLDTPSYLPVLGAQRYAVRKNSCKFSIW